MDAPGKLNSRRFGLEGKARLKTLSKGGYAKVALAVALAIDPEVLILDEPTSGLDLFTRREFLSSMVELAAAPPTGACPPSGGLAFQAESATVQLPGCIHP